MSWPNPGSAYLTGAPENGTSNALRRSQPVGNQAQAPRRRYSSAPEYPSYRAARHRSAWNIPSNTSMALELFSCSLVRLFSCSCSLVLLLVLLSACSLVLLVLGLLRTVGLSWVVCISHRAMRAKVVGPSGYWLLRASAYHSAIGAMRSLR